MKQFLKKIHLYYFMYKFYIPLKKIKNRKRYLLHYNSLLSQLEINKLEKKIFYIGVPYHNNLGDQAQYYCIRKFIESNYSDYKIIEIMDDIIFMNFKYTMKVLKKCVSDTDMFIFQSGYRTTDVANFGGEYAHQAILKNFNNKVIVFPQTVNFENAKEMKKSSEAYKKNNNYIFLARDKVSYDTALKIYSNERVLLYPDIVTTLIGNFIPYNNKKDGILLCLRNDAEKLYSNEMYSSLINKLKSISNKIEITDTNSQVDFEFDKSLVESEIKSKIEYFSKFKLIITDRYHGTIFSLISNTKVLVLNSTDHKLSSGVAWFDGRYDEFVTYCNDFDGVFDLAKDIYGTETEEITKSLFKSEFYDLLRGKIDEITK